MRSPHAEPPGLRGANSGDSILYSEPGWCQVLFPAGERRAAGLRIGAGSVKGGGSVKLEVSSVKRQEGACGRAFRLRIGDRGLRSPYAFAFSPSPSPALRGGVDPAFPPGLASDPRHPQFQTGRRIAFGFFGSWICFGLRASSFGFSLERLSAISFNVLRLASQSLGV